MAPMRRTLSSLRAMCVLMLLAFAFATGTPSALDGARESVDGFSDDIGSTPMDEMSIEAGNAKRLTSCKADSAGCSYSGTVLLQRQNLTTGGTESDSNNVRANWWKDSFSKAKDVASGAASKVGKVKDKLEEVAKEKLEGAKADAEAMAASKTGKVKEKTEEAAKEKLEGAKADAEVMAGTIKDKMGKTNGNVASAPGGAKEIPEEAKENTASKAGKVKSFDSVCVCNGNINARGGGGDCKNWNKKGKGKWCYVNEDSVCPDAKPGRQSKLWYSFAACVVESEGEDLERRLPPVAEQ